jgi:hypothetical protein
MRDIRSWHERRADFEVLDGKTQRERKKQLGAATMEGRREVNDRMLSTAL